ncbi:MAG: hypothetical protein Q4G66_09860 [bacterium]|nr:hypothetical protein [bacterium]
MTAQQFLLSGVMLGVLGLAAGCASTDMQNPAPAAAARTAAPALTCFGVLPVQVSVSEDRVLTADEEKALSAGAAVVDAILRNALSANKKARMLDVDQIGGLQAPDAVVNLETSREVAQSVGCNAILETSLSRYVEREGGPYGVQEPAAVTLAYRLYDVGTGTVLCHGRFDEQQQSVMENLFTLGKAGRRGMTWLTAEELAREGLMGQLGQCKHLTK